MASLERRITRLEHLDEAARTRRVYRMVAAEFGMTADDLERECEAFLSQPLDVKLAEIDQLYAESLAEQVPWPEYAEVRQTIIEYHRP